MQTIGIGKKELNELFMCLGAIMRLGLIEFEGSADDSRIAEGASQREAKYVAALLGVDYVKFENSLIEQYVVTPTDEFSKRNSVQKSKEVCDSFARHFYSVLFSKMVKQANDKIGYESKLRTQFTIAPNPFSKLTKLKTKFGISCFKEGVSAALKSRYHPVLYVSYLVFVLAFLENLRFGLQFGLARKRNLVV